MKRIVLWAVLCLLPAGNGSAADNAFLESAVRSVPPRYLAEVPIADRENLWKMLVSSRLVDENAGWIHFQSDGDSPPATSMFWVKLLPVADGNPLVFVHMSKPFADGSVPARNQTFVLRQKGKAWEDVTGKVIPKEVDLTMHFRPRRSGPVVEAAVYERFKIDRDGGRTAYRFGKRKQDLVWENGTFRVRKADRPELSRDDGTPASQ